MLTHNGRFIIVDVFYHETNW